MPLTLTLAENVIPKGTEKQAFVRFIHEMSGGTLPKKQVWVNVVHTVDGAWNLDGHAMTNEQLVQAISGETISAG